MLKVAFICKTPSLRQTSRPVSVLVYFSPFKAVTLLSRRTECSLRCTGWLYDAFESILLFWKLQKGIDGSLWPPCMIYEGLSYFSLCVVSWVCNTTMLLNVHESKGWYWSAHKIFFNKSSSSPSQPPQTQSHFTGLFAASLWTTCTRISNWLENESVIMSVFVQTEGSQTIMRQPKKSKEST